MAENGGQNTKQGAMMIHPILVSEAMDFFGLSFEQMVQFPRIPNADNGRAMVDEYEVSQAVGQQGPWLGKQQSAVLQVLRRGGNGGMLEKDITDAMEITESSARHALMGLVELGMVERTKGPHNGGPGRSPMLYRVARAWVEVQ